MSASPSTASPTGDPQSKPIDGATTDGAAAPASGAEVPAKGTADQSAGPSAAGTSSGRPAELTYSQLLRDLDKGLVKDLELSPRQREVRVTFKDGRKESVAVFSNDQMLLRAAEEARVPLTVRDDVIE